MSGPPLVLGLPLYGPGDHLEEALESLLGQTHSDLAIVVTDDAGHPEAKEILDRFGDSRLIYQHNPVRLGLIGNWRHCFGVARAAFPEAPYFAWTSDHDAWHPHWAERLLAVLDDDRTAMVAYPRTHRMDRNGHTLRTREWTFDTAQSSDAAHRVRATVWGMSAGNMVYGIFRVQALERAGVFRYALQPDRLLLTEVSLQGDLRQCRDYLFYRRVTEAPSLERQRAAFWPDRAPRWSRLPWSWQHIALLSMALARGEGPPALDAHQRVRLAGHHAIAITSYASKASVGRLYYQRIVRRRSLKRLLLGGLVRTAHKLEGHLPGRLFLSLARSVLDLRRSRAS